ncbi:PQQ-binding-like beta-propeller repeat protein [Rhodococcus sp. G-MC3]|uniref:outer membrane protein assembly factor BamB family protein n=1 Tax=Rhodococcus sp. G-MC3 TaxID=3046209 RepID=UPI0024B8CD37|nr:PQQ-binding-like beta-propeller repeat protein [Rhodococcus sp. G-MC3]MDJ0392013.1 PQQ-binding-like beta-propeller repeat protein [Rhodococcus sp. G-MC3]
MLGGRADFARVAVLATVVALVSAACGGSGDTIDAFAPGSWPAVHGDARNSNSTGHTGLSDLSLEWSRPLGGTVVTPLSIASSGQMFVSTTTDAGCNVFSFDIESGRKQWCNRLGPSVATATPLVDSVANVYVGDDGGFSSYNDHGQLRWRTPTYGVPRSAQFLGDGSVLAITQLGQVNILDTQTGQSTVAIHDLISPPDFLDAPDTGFSPPETGLAECATGAADCPVAAAPAVDLEASNIYLVLWRPGAIAPQLVSLHYDADATPAVTERWSSDLLPAGVASSPVLSEDGNTVYVADVDGRLNAYNSSDGSSKWTFGAGFGASATPSVGADGFIVPAGGPGVRSISDDGDHASVRWSRDDIEQAGTPVQTADGTALVVTRRGDGLMLESLDANSGNTTSSTSLPGATGFTVGTSIGPDGQVITSTYLGEIFTYTD